jgi:iron complex transport system ATP-binding protein
MPGSRLETNGIDVRIGNVSVCQHLNLTINAGECWAILGRNGAGKTTLLHTLAGLHSPDSGVISLQGDSLEGLPRRTIARHIGLLLQTCSGKARLTRPLPVMPCMRLDWTAWKIAM